jgi:predicted GNAT family acetyltransferase
MDLGRYGFEISRLSVIHIPGDRNIYYYIPEKDWLIPDREHMNLGSSMTNLVYMLRGDEVEEIDQQVEKADLFKKLDTAARGDKIDKFWGAFGTKFDGTKDVEFYRHFIHPITRKAVEAIVAKSDKDDIRIVDIFAGNGNLLNGLYSDLEKAFPDKQFEFEMYERNEKSLGAARARFKKADNVTVHPSTDLTSSKELADVFKDKPFVVTATGGINRQVVTKEQAMAVAKKVYESLQDGGYFVVTGLSTVLLTADEFKSIGFKVLNKSLPLQFGHRSTKWLYILQKSESDKAQLGEAKESEVRTDSISVVQAPGEILQVMENWLKNGERKVYSDISDWEDDIALAVKENRKMFLYYIGDKKDPQAIAYLEKKYSEKDIIFLSTMEAGTRGQGLGGRLMECIIKDLGHNTMEVIPLFSGDQKERDGVKRFYEKYGFAELSLTRYVRYPDKSVGGIDFTADKLNLNVKEEKGGVNRIKPYIDPQSIHGLYPVILNIRPVTNLPLLLGIREDEPKAIELSKN